MIYDDINADMPTGKLMTIIRGTLEARSGVPALEFNFSQNLQYHF